MIWLIQKSSEALRDTSIPNWCWFPKAFLFDPFASPSTKPLYVQSHKSSADHCFVAMTVAYSTTMQLGLSDRFQLILTPPDYQKPKTLLQPTQQRCNFKEVSIWKSSRNKWYQLPPSSQVSIGIWLNDGPSIAAQRDRTARGTEYSWRRKTLKLGSSGWEHSVLEIQKYYNPAQWKGVPPDKQILVPPPHWHWYQTEHFDIKNGYVTAWLPFSAIWPESWTKCIFKFGDIFDRKVINHWSGVSSSP